MSFIMVEEWVLSLSAGFGFYLTYFSGKDFLNVHCVTFIGETKIIHEGIRQLKNDVSTCSRVRYVMAEQK